MVGFRKFARRMVLPLRKSPLPDHFGPVAYDRLVNAPSGVAGTANIYGRPFRYSDGVGFIHSIREIFVDEVYKFKARSESPYIIDAGANIGLSILYFKMLYPSSEVYGIEPDAAIFAMLDENVGRMPGVTLIKAAANTDTNDITFYPEGSLAGSTEVNCLGAGTPVTVPSIRLKSELSDRKVDFLKIDIEGAENRVLFDIEDELDNVDNLFFEYHNISGTPQALPDLLAMIARRGFRYIINDAVGPAHPFFGPVEGAFDTQLNVSCFRPEPR